MSGSLFTSRFLCTKARVQRAVHRIEADRAVQSGMYPLDRNHGLFGIVTSSRMSKWAM